MKNPRWLSVVLVIVYALVVICLFMGKNMLSMYLMGFGMLGEAIYGLVTNWHDSGK
ncbi:hypothetical protein ACFQHW_02470 [Lapidilactobacillus achengensis]|uniref:Uncharacterized protein n=1 Tax=Lapidilactobacillus achengensis TaxID=2486000 RepID=A0ABW1UMY9_9LACO|nr:hypothetical protein [Lapidilactobacillus achengensis]